MAGEPGNAPIDRILQKIAQTRRHLRSVANNPKATPSDVLSDPAFREIADALTEEAAAMPPVIQRIAAQVGRTAEASVVTTAGSELEKRYRQLVVQPCNGVLPGRYPFSATSARELPMGDFERLFGYGGLFDQFFDENLQSLVDTAGPSWTWRAGVLTGSRDMLERFAAARRIRDLFFRRDSPAPDVRFTVSTDANSPPIPRLVLEIDGQYFDSDSRQVRQGVWPGPSPGRAAARIEGRNGVETAADATGTWGLFKLFDRHARRVTETRFVLAFDVAGQKARMTIDADRVDNPFARRDWQRFSCGS
jgi:type VI secretion system protein ImpL